jgi:hypothetical protein
MHRFGVAGGMESGGNGEAMMDVFTEPFSRRHFPEFPDVAAEIAAHRRVTVFTVVWNSDSDLIGQHLITDKKHATELVALPDSDVFVSSFAPPPRLLIFGANSFAAALTVQAELLGYRVTICDSRPNFATPESFPGAEVVVDWPHRYLNTLSAAGEIDSSTAIVVLSHDPTFDIPLLTVALRLPELGYLGAMGSRQVQSGGSRICRQAVSARRPSRGCTRPPDWTSARARRPRWPWRSPPNCWPPARPNRYGRPTRTVANSLSRREPLWDSASDHFKPGFSAYTSRSTDRSNSWAALMSIFAARSAAIFCSISASVMESRPLAAVSAETTSSF